MKIYPNNNVINIRSTVNKAVDIPLAYVDTTTANLKIDTSFNKSFSKSSKTEVLPYDEVNTQMCLFDENENLIPFNDMVRNFVKQRNKYLYVPKNDTINFKPMEFKYCLRAQRSLSYQSNMIYNITASFYNNKSYANKLMQIFGDAADRSMAPKNVTVNNGDLSLNRLYSNVFTNDDFNFIYLQNMNTILLDDSTKIFNKEIIQNENKTNLFLLIHNDSSINITSNQKFNNDIVNMLYSTSYKEYKFSSPNIYNSSTIMTKYFFNIPKDTDKVRYHNLFNNSDTTPVLIEETIGKGFTIYMPESLFENLAVYYYVFYEVMLYVYFNSYIYSDTITSWISDVIPDYTVRNGKLLRNTRFLSEYDIDTLLNAKSSDVKNVQVLIDSEKYPYVLYTGRSHNHLGFVKNKGDNNEYADPSKKPDGYISLYTNGEIFFFKNFVYKINDSIEDCINISQTDKYAVVSFKKYRNSDNGIYVKFDQDPIKIPLTTVINNIETQVNNKTYYIICDANDSASNFRVIESSQYRNENIMATIKLSLDTDNLKSVVYDMRQRGGGLPEGEEDNFDCFDIGNIYGRPYRKGGTLIITLPAYLKPHKDFIMEIVKQYMVADDYPVILFKED